MSKKWFESNGNPGEWTGIIQNEFVMGGYISKETNWKGKKE